jgi:tape measure domain-containing protein
VPEIDPVILQLRADLNTYRNTLKSTTVLVENSLRQQERAVASLESRMDRGFGAIEGRSRAFATRLTGLLSGVSAAALLQTLVKVADQAKQIDAQLRLATNGFGSFNQAQQDSRRIAEETRTSLDATTKLYGAFVRASEQTGRSQADAARATETFSKALKIGGAGAQEAASATLQFNQALASGVLRGEEFNAIAEASPRVLRLLADALGVPQGKLRELAAEGKITSDQLYRALTDVRFTAGIDEEFRTLPVTFGEAMQQVENAAIITFGAFDRGGEFSTALANFVTDGTAGFAELEEAGESLGVEVRAALEGLGDAFNPLLDGGNAVFDALGGRVAGLRESIASLLKAYDDVANFVPSIGNAAKRFDNRVFGTNFQEEALSDASGRFTRGFDQSARNSGRRNVGRGDGGVVDPNARTTPVVTGGGGAKPKKKSGPSAETLARREQAERLRQLRNDEAFASERAALDQDLLRAKQALVTAADVLATYERQEIEAARVRQNASYQADVAQKKLTQAQADQLVAANDAVAAERARAVDIRERQRLQAEAVSLAEADLGNARDVAAAEAQLAETNDDRRASAIRLLDLEYELERLRLEAVQASETSTAAEKEIARRRLATLGILKAADEEGIRRDTESPFERYKRDLESQSANIGDELEQIGVDALGEQVDELSDSLGDAAAGFLGLKGAAADAVSSIIADLARLAIQQGILALIGAVGGGGGGGSTLSSFAGGFAPARASGGYVRPGQMYRVNEGASPGRVEGFRPQGSGTIIPLGQMKAAQPSTGTTVVHAPQFNLRGAVITRELYADMQRISNESAQQAGQASYARSMRDAPAAVRKAQRYGTPIG